jgi:hypothetical protein
MGRREAPPDDRLGLTCRLTLVTLKDGLRDANPPRRL